MMPKLKVYKRFGSKHQGKRNWNVYNKQLIRRSELNISLDFIDNWDQELQQMNDGKVGRKYIYPEKFIKWTALVYHVMNMPYRTIQGFLHGLSRYIRKLKAADYTTLFRRIRYVEINLKDSIPVMNGSYVVAIDTTGVKITTRGDWPRYKWKLHKEHRGWIKIHMAVDTRRKEILAVDITDEKKGDDSGFKDLMDQCYENIGNSKIEKILADGAYDRVKIFNYLDRNEIQSGIKMRKDANVSEYKGSTYRRECIWRREEIGHTAWKKEVGYGKRWASEAVFSSVKRMLGEYVRSKTKPSAKREAYRKFVFYNVLNNFGRGKISGI